jgi:hypothetical protein
MSVHLSLCFKLSNQWPKFDETWYEHYAFGGHSSLVLFNFISQLITTWQTQELVKLQWH